jgi:hypothetical protein
MSLFTKSLTVEDASQALFALMRTDFNREWLSTLSQVPGLDLRRAETELIFLDFFAIYFSLKFTRAAGWRDKGPAVFERFFGLVVSWWGDVWAGQGAGTRDDAFKVLDKRLKVYGKATEDPSSADSDEMLRSIGLAFAMFAFLDDSCGAPGSDERHHHYDDFLTKLLLDHRNLLTTVGGEVFNHRMKSLYGMFDSYRVR